MLLLAYLPDSTSVAEWKFHFVGLVVSARIAIHCSIWLVRSFGSAYCEKLEIPVIALAFEMHHQQMLMFPIRIEASRLGNKALFVAYSSTVFTIPRASMKYTQQQLTFLTSSKQKTVIYIEKW